MSRPIRVVIADDHNLVRAGIRSLLENVEGVVVVGEAHNGRDAVALAARHEADLVVLDIGMQELNGIEAAARIAADQPGTRVLMLSMHESQSMVRRAIKAGAGGYLVKDAVPQELGMAVAAVMRGELYLSPRIARHAVGPGEASALDLLTSRQREILQLIAEGRSTREMASLLAVSHKTVEAHRAGLMERLGIHDVAGLTLFAARHGLVAMDRPQP